MTSSQNSAAEPINSASLRELGWVDLVEGLKRWRLWQAIAWIEIRQRYRRAIIGPFWITISIGILILGLGLIFGNLFKMPLKDYLPFLSVGLILWNLISTLMIEGCQVFISSEGTIKQLPVPISVHVYRMVWRNLIVLAHNIVIYAAVVVYFDVPIGWSIGLALVGIALISVNGVAFGLWLGLLSTRFRDIPQIVINAVQLIFFATPIVWKPETLSGRTFIVDGNPFYYLVEVVRQPLLGGLPSFEHWVIAFFFTSANLALGIALYTRYWWRIPYWV